MDERQTDALDDLHKRVVDKALGSAECNHGTGCGEKSSQYEPTVYGPLANEMLSTTADFGNHESVRDCLATLADRLENLEAAYASLTLAIKDSSIDLLDYTDKSI